MWQAKLAMGRVGEEYPLSLGGGEGVAVGGGGGGGGAVPENPCFLQSETFSDCFYGIPKRRVPSPPTF